MTACLATIFGCAYEFVHRPEPASTQPARHLAVPLVDRVAGLRIRKHLQFSLTQADIDRLGTDRPMRSPWSWPGLWMAGVWSPRHAGETHAVVMRGRDLVWDPHPQREQGHLGFESAEVFYPIDPSALAVTRPQPDVDFGDGSG